jgi:phage gpG-like protein
MTKNLLKEIEKKVIRYVEKDLPRIAGKMAVDEFRENFHRQGFRNNGITRWPDVKRRDKNSPWYGFQYKGEKRTSVRFVRDRKTGKTRRSKTQKKLNYSNAATKRGILIGPGANLMNSITEKERSKDKVVIGSDLPYAAVHNEGGTIKVFGKAVRKLPKRQFIGESRELMDELQKKYLADIDRITDEVADSFNS